MSTTKNFADVIRQKLKADPALAAAVEDARFNANIAEEVYNARKQAGKTQTKLAELVGMKQSAIARMEDADYGRHSITSLRRIASALCKRLEIKLVNTYTSEEHTTGQSIGFEIKKPEEWSTPSNTWGYPSGKYVLPDGGLKTVCAYGS